MMRKLQRSLAAVLAGLLVCPAPNLWALNVATPATAHGAAPAMAMPLPVVSQSIGSGMMLSGMGTLSAPALTGTLSGAPRVSITPAMEAEAAITAVPAAVPQAVLPQVETVSPGALPSGAAPTVAAKVIGMSESVRGDLAASGPLAKAAPEAASNLGSQVFRRLAGGLDLNSDAVAVPVVPAKEGKTAAAANLTQQKMLASLYEVAAIFAEQYGPMDWKKQQFQVDLRREYGKVKDAILADPQITHQKFQDLLLVLVNAMRDYHVSILFYSTERARLPFMVFRGGDKYFLSYIDRDKLPFKSFPFKTGDEIVSFGGKPIADVMRDVASVQGSNKPDSDLRWAELFLTNRRRTVGYHVPQGDVALVIRSRNGRTFQVKMPWDYQPEFIPQNVPVRDAGLMAADKGGGAAEASAAAALAGPAPAAQAGSMKNFLSRAFTGAMHPLASVFSAMREEDEDNPFMMGARQSFVPRLGQVLWQSKKDDPFQAYIFKTKSGRKYGFIRISSYIGGAKETKRFGELMAKFQKEVDKLVIDQVNNPGGMVEYLYKLASHLTDKPLATPHHRLIIDEGAVQEAADFLLRAMQPQQARRAAPKILDKSEEDDLAGYPMTKKFVVLLLQFYKFIIEQFDAGKRLTDLTHLRGIDSIDPAPKAEERFTKPILLLTNALDFSGGDFFPAIMQDNKRAAILGPASGTGGAGGMVRSYDLPNQFGIAELHATWSIAYRPKIDPKTGKIKYEQPLENLGVTPDIPYEFSEKDMRTGFAEYRLKILKALDELGSAPAPAPKGSK